MRPDRNVSRPINDIVEAALPKSFDQRDCFRPTGEIVDTIRGEDAIEEADMLGNFLGVRSVACRGQIDFLVLALRRTKKHQNNNKKKKRRVIDRGYSAE